MRQGVGALLGLLLSHFLRVRSADVDRGPQSLFRRLESNVKNGGRGFSFVSEAYLESHKEEHGGHAGRQTTERELNFNRLADPVECKKYCQRNRDDMVGYKCSVSLGAMVEECCQA